MPPRTAPQPRAITTRLNTGAEGQGASQPRRTPAGHVLALEVVARRGAELGGSGVQIARVPQGHGVEYEPQTGQLVLLPLPVCLPDLAAAAVADRAGQAVAGSWTVSCRFISLR